MLNKYSERYSRQELVLGKAKQKKLEKSTVAIVGVGALGTVASELLTRAGVGKLILIDRDVVEESNLHRQLLFTEKDIGKSKAKVAEEKLNAINSSVRIDSYAVHLNLEKLSLLKEADLILDCTDNLKTRFLLNDFCRKEKITWIYASGIRTEGYVMPIFPRGPCLRCFLREANLETCDTAGVLNTITTSIAALQTTPAIKVLIGEKVEPCLYHLNLNRMELKKIKINKNPNCPTCHGDYQFLNQKEEPLTKFCSAGKYQLTGKKVNLKEIKMRWSKSGKVIDDGIALRFGKIILFEDGRVLIKAKTEEEARSIYGKWVGE
ncbi:HesA/MoeB/ThiF family protein [Candidatus Woesearchaeota archaeon]|nr:HesA/MoeB/ThiF family protein [Candidatus Woesearchaeota archaeon]